MNSTNIDKAVDDTFKFIWKLFLKIAKWVIPAFVLYWTLMYILAYNFT